MTGPEHYAAAERLLEGAQEKEAPEWFANLVAEAQVHATLALAAATASAGNLVRWDDNQGPTDWQEVIYP